MVTPASFYSFLFTILSVDVCGTDHPREEGFLLVSAALCVCPVCGWRGREGDLPVDGEDELPGVETHAGCANRGRPGREHRVRKHLAHFLNSDSSGAFLRRVDGKIEKLKHADV